MTRTPFDAVHHAASDPQSTHATAAQASAAKTLKLLRSIYINVGPTQVEAQSSLIDYLDHVIQSLSPRPNASPPETTKSFTDTDIKAAKSNLGITQTIEIIDQIFTSPISNKDKIRIFKQMKSIAQTCPGFPAWNEYEQQWSKNKLYNAVTNKDELVEASPAETMNLVCNALLDPDRYLLNSETDKKLRIETLSKCLLKLQEHVEARQRQKCSAGRQHDLVFLLNQSFSVEPISTGNCIPLQLNADTGTFIHMCLSSYVDEKINTLPPSERAKLFLDWVNYNKKPLDTNADTDTSPMVNFFPNLESDCLQYLTSRCMDAGLNPQNLKLNDYANATTINCLPPSLGEPNLSALLNAILDEEEISELSDLTGVAASPRDINELIGSRNKALTQFKDRCECEPDIFFHDQSAIHDFHSALTLFKMLYRDHVLTPLMYDKDYAEFDHAQQSLLLELKNYFDHYPQELASSFKELEDTYLKSERQFRQLKHADFIENFFVKWKFASAVDRNQYIKFIIGIFDDAVKLSEKEIEAILRTENREINITVYLLNRILITALIQEKEHWPSNFIELFQHVLDGLNPDNPAVKLLFASTTISTSLTKDSYTPELCALCKAILRLNESEEFVLENLLSLLNFASRTELSTLVKKHIDHQLERLLDNITQSTGIENLIERFANFSIKRKNGFLILAETLYGIAKNSPESIEKISSIFNALIEKISGTPINFEALTTLINALSATSEEGPNRGKNAFYLLASALVWLAKNNPTLCPKITTIFLEILKRGNKNNVETFINALSATPKEGPDRDTNAFYLLVLALYKLARNNPTLCPNITTIFLEILKIGDKNNVETFINALSATLKEGPDRDTNAFFLLALALNCLAENNPTSCPNITTIFLEILKRGNKNNVETFINALSATPKEGPDRGTNALYLLASALAWLAKNNPKLCPNITTIFLVILKKLNSNDLKTFINALCATLEEGPNRGTNALYLLASALVWLSKNNPKLCPNITTIFLVILKKLNSNDLTTFINALWATLEEGPNRGKNAFYFLALALNCLAENNPTSCPNITTIFLEILKKLNSNDLKTFINALCATLKEGPDRGKNALYLLASALAWLAKNKPTLCQNITTIFVEILNKLNLNDLTTFINALSATLKESPDCGKNAFYFLALALNCLAENNPTSCPNITTIFPDFCQI